MKLEENESKFRDILDKLFLAIFQNFPYNYSDKVWIKEEIEKALRRILGFDDTRLKEQKNVVGGYDKDLDREMQVVAAKSFRSFTDEDLESVKQLLGQARRLEKHAPKLADKIWKMLPYRMKMEYNWSGWKSPTPFLEENRKEIHLIMEQEDDDFDKWIMGEYDKDIAEENPPSAEDVEADNSHGVNWKLIKVEDYGPETVGKKVFTKYALYKSEEGYECEYVFDSRSGKWELGSN